MLKAAPTYFEGQCLVLLSDLPNQQHDSLGKWIGDSDIISISVDGQSYHECVKYEDYELWYRNYFRLDRDQIL